MSNFRFTRPDNFPPILKNIIIINVLIWLAQMMYDKQYQLTDKLGLWPVKSENFKPYQVVTHMFAHSPRDFAHILFNMFALWMFGRILENVWGHKRFLFFYLASGLGAAFVHLLVQYLRTKDIHVDPAANIEDFDPGTISKIISMYVPAVGASGAIMGIMAAFAYLFPNTELYIMFIPVPIKAKWAVLGYVLLDLFGGIGQFAGDNIAHFAHLGGALTGFIIVYIWNKTNKRTLY